MAAISRLGCLPGTLGIHQGLGTVHQGLEMLPNRGLGNLPGAWCCTMGLGGAYKGLGAAQNGLGVPATSI